MIDYTKDKIRAIDAKFEAQKIAFAPIVFQAARALLELRILDAVSASGEKGLTVDEIAAVSHVSPYGVKVLIELALGLNIVKLLPDPEDPEEEERYTLGKTGWFLLEDEMTRVNLNFVNDVCYKGAFELTESIKTGKPLGLEVLMPHAKTIYEVLSSLPEKAKESWFAFDHFYSDIGFEEALPLVFALKPKKIMDIGGNTAKWAIRCCRYDPDVEVTIADLPGQTAMAEKSAAAAGFAGRIKTFSCNVLDEKTVFPSGMDAVWMSQFLVCFSLDEVEGIMRKVWNAAGPDTDVFIFDLFWDKQRFEAAAFALQASSLYFTCMANGNSKMYRYRDLAEAATRAGFELKEVHHNLGSNSYSLLRCRKKQDG